MAAAGEPVTVAAVGQRAGVSTATAYRYFSDVQTLIEEAVLDLDLDRPDAALAEFAQRSQGLVDPLERLILAQRQLLAMVAPREAEYRLYLACQLQRQVREAAYATDRPRSGALKRAMIEAALDGLRRLMPAEAFDDLVQALLLATGLCAYLVLRDEAGLQFEAMAAVNDQVLRDIYAARTARVPPA